MKVPTTPDWAMFSAKTAQNTLYSPIHNFWTYKSILKRKMSLDAEILQDFCQGSKVMKNDTYEPLKVAHYSSAPVSQIDPCVYFKY